MSGQSAYFIIAIRATFGECWDDITVVRRGNQQKPKAKLSKFILAFRQTVKHRARWMNRKKYFENVNESKKNFFFLQREETRQLNDLSNFFRLRFKSSPVNFDLFSIDTRQPRMQKSFLYFSMYNEKPREVKWSVIIDRFESRINHRVRKTFFIPPIDIDFKWIPFRARLSLSVPLQAN